MTGQCSQYAYQSLGAVWGSGGPGERRGKAPVFVIGSPPIHRSGSFIRGSMGETGTSLAFSRFQSSYEPFISLSGAENSEISARKQSAISFPRINEHPGFAETIS